MWSDQAPWDWRWIARIHSQGSGIDNKIDVRELHSHCRFFHRYGFKARCGAKHASFHKKRTQTLSQSVCFFQSSIDEDKALRILERALPGNSATCSAPGADYEHSKIADIDREL